MKAKAFLISFGALLIIGTHTLTQPARAQMMGNPRFASPSSETLFENNHKSLDLVLEDLLTRYQKSTLQELDCQEVTDNDFERLGDAWMETIHPGEAHERMDAMMGGEGSVSLQAAHIQMGQNYLGCNTGTLGTPVRGMMGGMMNWWPNAGGYQNPQTLASSLERTVSIQALLSIFLSLVAIAALVSLTRYLWKKGGERK